MIYNCADDWNSASSKRVLFFGMSGVGKTRISSILRQTGQWFHYSVDYRIGTRYMGEHIADNYKREAMKNAFFANLLKSDSISISSNISFGNLEPLSTYLGKPGNADRGGIPIAEYRRRQQLYRDAEIDSLRDTVQFIDRATDLYDYPNFVCDTGGSICEVINPDEDQGGLLAELSRHLLLVWIRGGPDHADQLIERFNRSPKPMCYRQEFLDRNWSHYLALEGQADSDVDPDEFATWIYAKALETRQPRYEVMASRFGIAIDAPAVMAINSETEISRLIAEALDRRALAACNG